MRGPTPAAEFAQPLFVQRRNPFGDRKLVPRVPSAAHPIGDDGPCGPLVRGEQTSVSIRCCHRYEVTAILKATALLLFACLASSAIAAESPRCASLEKAQEAAGNCTAIAPLTSAEFHFLQGVYVLSPTTPDGLPPGDGALLLTRDHGDEGPIL